MQKGLSRETLHKLTNEIEVALPAQADGDQADHLVQGQAAVHHQGGAREDGHVGVHLLVHQPEGDGLVAHQRLVVALSVRDARF